MGELFKLCICSQKIMLSKSLCCFALLFLFTFLGSFFLHFLSFCVPLFSVFLLPSPFWCIFEVASQHHDKVPLLLVVCDRNLVCWIMYSIFTSIHLSVADEVGRDVMVADPTIHVAVFTITEHGDAYDYCPYKPLPFFFLCLLQVGKCMWLLLSYKPLLSLFYSVYYRLVSPTFFPAFLSCLLILCGIWKTLLWYWFHSVWLEF